MLIYVICVCALQKSGVAEGTVGTWATGETSLVPGWFFAERGCAGAGIALQGAPVTDALITMLNS